jgi:hypothetical protein
MIPEIKIVQENKQNIFLLLFDRTEKRDFIIKKQIVHHFVQLK